MGRKSNLLLMGCGGADVSAPTSLSAPIHLHEAALDLNYGSADATFTGVSVQNGTLLVCVSAENPAGTHSCTVNSSPADLVIQNSDNTASIHAFDWSGGTTTTTVVVTTSTGGWNDILMSVLCFSNQTANHTAVDTDAASAASAGDLTLNCAVASGEIMIGLNSSARSNANTHTWSVTTGTEIDLFTNSAGNNNRALQTAYNDTVNASVNIVFDPSTFPQIGGVAATFEAV